MVRMRPKRLSLTVQRMALRSAFPESHIVVKPSELIWKGLITPTPMSQTYHVEVSYKLNSSPKVRVIEPVLETRDGKRCEHLYPGDYLCLFFPGQWDGSMLIADTILPWASEWLMYYEIWIATGLWEGGGFHPVTPKQRKSSKAT